MRKHSGGGVAGAFALAAFVLAAFVLALPAHGGGIDRLNEFIRATQSATGEFEQRIYGRDGKVVQASRGTLAFFRPGKFR